jgi:hypothetical protein
MSAPERLENPFPGLRPFERDQADLFFGREGQSDELLRRLRENWFLAVVGTSGSGKSSLVRAGLVASLHRGLMRAAGSGWRIATFRPGDDPIGNLARALSAPDVIGTDAKDSLHAMTIEVVLRRGALGLVEVVAEARLPAGENLLVVVDQFEELFRFQRTAGEQERFREDAAAFVKLLLEATRQQKVPTYVVLTMRSDYVGDCAQFRDLPEAINLGQYLIPRMTREERRLAVTGPVLVAEGEIAPRLVNRLLNDAGDDPGQLPILQHALMRTWDYWKDHHVDGEPLDLRHYEAIGGMAKALSEHAGKAYDELRDARSQAIAEKLFKRLTEKGPDNREIRRPTKLGELCAVAGASESEVVAVIDAFRKPDRAFLMPSANIALTLDTPIDISHESLIRGWERLKEWVEQEAESAETYKDLAKTAARRARGDAEPLHGLDLQVKQKWWDDNRPNEAWAQAYDPRFAQVQGYLAESKAKAEHERKHGRQVKWAFAGGLVALFFFLSWSWYSARQSWLQFKEATLVLRAARNNDLQHYSNLMSAADQVIELSGAPNARVLKAMALSYTGQHDSAVAEYTRALGVDSTYWVARINRCDEYLNLGNAKSASLDCMAVLNENPRSFLVHLNLAVAWWMQGDYDRAKSAFDRSIDATHYETSDASQSIVSPTIKQATGQSSLSLRGREVRAALYFARASVLASQGAEGFAGALAEADRQPRWSRDPLFNALNWIWLQYKGLPGEMPADSGYGAFAAEGALWERAGFEGEARHSYVKFQRGYQSHPQGYADLARWVSRRLWYLRVPRFMRAATGSPREAEDVLDLELKAQEFQGTAKQDSAVAYLDSALKIASSDSALYVDLLLQRAGALVGLTSWEAVQKAADTIISRDSLRATAYYYRALANWRTDPKKYGQAILADLKKDLEYNPNDLGGLWVSYWMLVESAPDTALDRLERASHLTGLDADTHWLYYQMAKTQNLIAGTKKNPQKRRELYQQARRSIDAALALTRAELSYYDERAKADSGFGKPLDEVRHNRVEGYRRAAEIRERQGDRDKALEAYVKREILARDTREAEAVKRELSERISHFVWAGLGRDRIYYWRADFLNANGRQEAALRAINSAISIEGDSLPYYLERQTIERSLGRPEAEWRHHLAAGYARVADRKLEQGDSAAVIAAAVNYFEAIHTLLPLQHDRTTAAMTDIATAASKLSKAVVAWKGSAREAAEFYESKIGEATWPMEWDSTDRTAVHALLRAEAERLSAGGAR